MNNSMEIEQQRLRENWIQGTHCQCCKQFVKIYTRQFNSRQAMSLIGLVRLFKDDGDFHNYRQIPGFATDFAQMKRWDLIEEASNDDTRKKHSGFYKPTQLAIEFVTNRAVTIPKYIVVYNAKTLSFKEEQVNIVDALGDHFDYEELMRR